MKGRKPKPTHLKLVEGNPGKRAINKNEPKPEALTPRFAAPAHLSTEQRAIWQYAVQHAPPGMLSRIDRETLAAWVIASDLHRQAIEAVNREGILVQRPGKLKPDGTREEPTSEPYQNPYLAVVNKQALILLRAAAELGFTPSSRTRVKVDGPGLGKGDEPDSPWSEFG